MSNSNAIPLSYKTPEFPSLYWPFDASRGEAIYLYTLTDIWRFTLFWTLITIPTAHFLVALIAIVTQFSSAYQRSQYLKQFKTSSRDVRRQGRGGNGVIDTHTRRGDNEDVDGEKGPRRVKQLSAKNRKLVGTSPYKEALQVSGAIFALYMFMGVVEATISGNLVGVVLGAVYNAGFFRMSVWTPLCWGIINMLVLILASFRISGGL